MGGMSGRTNDRQAARRVTGSNTQESLHSCQGGGGEGGEEEGGLGGDEMDLQD